MAGEDKVSRHGVHEIDSARLAAFELVTNSVLVPCAAAALARLHVFEALAGTGDGAQLTADEIAAKALPGKAINVTYLERLLRFMSVSQILSETTVKGGDGQAEHRYALAPIGRFLVEDAAGGSLVTLLQVCESPAMLSVWDHLDAAILDVTVPPFARAHGGLNVWEYSQRNREWGEMINQGWAGHSRLYLGAILEVYRGFDEVKVLVDVGGGLGASLEQITKRHPHINGVNFDQPHVIEACPKIPGVELISGNFFESVPAVGDAILMKTVLHDWDDEKCLRILHNCYQALPAHGKLIVMDCVLPEGSDFRGGDGAAFSLDVAMLGNFGSDARERTEGDLRKLAMGAGFAQVAVVCRVDYLAVLECRK